MLQVIASDLDGTLLGSDRRLDPLTASTLRELDAMGVHIVLATARHYLDASRVRDAMGVRAYLITANGARLYSPAGDLLLARDLDPASARALMGPEIAGSRLIFAAVDAACLMSRPCHQVEAYCEAAGLPVQIQDLASHDGVGVAKVSYTGQMDDLARIEAEIRGHLGDRVCITFAAGYLEVMGAAVSKGNALKEILRRLGVPPSGCAGFGDDENDLDMLSVTGRPFVMSGASAKLLAALPEALSAGNCDEAGVARTLRGLFGLSV